MILKLVFLVNCVFLVSGCSDTVMLHGLERRARNYRADGQNDPYVNDYILIDRWYSVNKLEQQYLMPDSNKMPPYFSCGGYEPIYIDGTHPDPDTLTDTPVDVVACLRNTFDDCDYQYDIKIRKCDGEVQYFLVPTKQHSAYCFDPPELQEGDGTFSPPPTDANLGSVEIKPSLHFTQENKLIQSVTGEWHDTINYTPYVIFTCMFNVQSTYFYAVNWYLNGNVFRVFGPTQSVEDLVLHEDTFTDNGITLGFTLKCGIRVLQDATGYGTTMVSSPEFFAGIKILTPRLDLPKNGEKAVELKLTVPLGCQHNSHTESPSCVIGLSMFDPVGYTCDVANVAQVSNSRVCGQDLTGLTFDQVWNPESVYYFNVTTVDENYQDRAHFTLQLRTDEEFGHKFWTNYQPDNIQVVVNDDEEYKNKICYSHVDPHIKTADGYHYENQKKGEYLLYRNKKFNIEVLEKTNTCNGGHALCTCGIIVRAGADAFEINLCGKVRFIEFLSCKEGGILKVLHNTNEQNYQIYTPIGTWINAYLHGTGTYDGFMNVDIMMSPKDINQTEGLCGYMDGSCDNDLIGRDGVTYPLLTHLHKYKRHHDSFSQSWNLTDDENLFKSPGKELKPWEATNALYCVCEQALEGSTGTTGRVAKTICSPTQYLDCHLTEGSETSKKCKKVTTRRKRSSQAKEDRELHRLMSLAYQHETELDRLPREVKEQNISESEAEVICGNAINGSMIVSELSDSLVGEDPNAVISQCLFDVMVGNDKSLAGVHVDALNSIAQMKFKRDPEYVSDNTEKVKIFIKQSCPNNCSDRGGCSDEGVCMCDKFFHGYDCGIDERDPVHIDDMEGGGLCNLTDGDGCECFYIRTHFLLPNFKCAITATEIYIDGSEKQTTFIPDGGEYEDIFTGLCCIPEVREERSVSQKIVFSTRYDTAVSNDGLNFGPAESLHVFSSECQDALPDAEKGFRIVLKSDYCFIDGMCVVYKETQIADDCFACNPDVNKYSWTKICRPTDTEKNNHGVILRANVGSLVCIFVLIGFIFDMVF